MTSMSEVASLCQAMLGAQAEPLLHGALRRSLKVETLRQDQIGNAELRVDVKGLDQFDIADLSGELQDARQILELVPGSPASDKMEPEAATDRPDRGATEDVGVGSGHRDTGDVGGVDPHAAGVIV